MEGIFSGITFYVLTNYPQIAFVINHLINVSIKAYFLFSNPLIFQVSISVAIAKIDTLPIFKFDTKLCKEYIKRRNKDAEIYEVSAVKKIGVDKLVTALKKRITK